MKYSIYRFTLDLQKHDSQVSIACFKHDTAVQLRISLTDGGKPYTIDHGCSAVLHGKRPDDRVLVEGCMIQGNTEIIYTFSDSIANISGVVNCQLKLYGEIEEDKELITAPRFTIVVDERIVGDADIEVDGETVQSALDRLIGTENTRVTNETQRIQNEEERAAAEEARVKAEEDRVYAESRRAKNEAVRNESEHYRAEHMANFAENENGRAYAEAERGRAEEERIRAEKARIQDEENRYGFEELRIKAEAKRDAAETERWIAEQGRLQAEEKRIQAEEIRIFYETLRQEGYAKIERSESEREQAELLRKGAEEWRATEFKQHNYSPTAHEDIRDRLTNIIERLNALVSSDETTLDQLREMVAYISSNADLIEGITTNKVSVADIVNNLDTNLSDKPLSAAQGVALRDLCTALGNNDKIILAATEELEESVRNKFSILEPFVSGSSNALKRTTSGEVVQVTDSSPIPHLLQYRFARKREINHIPIMDSISKLGSAPIDVVNYNIDGATIVIPAAASVYGFQFDGSKLKVGDTYTFSIDSITDHAGSVGSGGWGWQVAYKDGSTDGTKSGYPTATFTIAKEASYVRFYIGFPYTGNKDIFIEGLRAYEGEEDKTKYRICGSKNLIPFPYEFESGTNKGGLVATIQDDGGICINGTRTGTEPSWFLLSSVAIDLEDNISSYTIYNSVTGDSSFKFVANSSIGNDLPNTSTECSWYVLQSTDNKIYLAVKPGTYENLVVYPQIEVGQVSTSYEKGEPLELLNLSLGGNGEVVSRYPIFTIWASDGSPVEVDYNRDISAEIAELRPNERLEEYGLPILYLEGDTTGMSKEFTRTLNYRFRDREGTCTLKWQGSSSIAWAKKNYTIKFDNKFEAKDGWGEQKKYCLKANYVDASHARNIVSARIWADFVKSRTTPSERLLAAPNCGAVDGFPIIIVLNGDFHGLYTFNIPKDGWTYGMGEGANEAAICAEGVQDHLGKGHDGRAITGFKQLAVLDGCDFSIEYCPDEDNTEWIKTSINRLISAVMNSDGTDIDTTIAQYLDIESAIDYYIHTVFTKGFDNVTRNYVLTTYDGVKWIFNGYDMDSTFGLQPGTGFLPNEVHHVSLVQCSVLNDIFGLIYKYKKDALKARYRQLRDLGTSGLIENAGALASDVPMLKALWFISEIPQGVYNEDWNKWRGIKYTSTNNYAQISEFMLKRLKYMDEEIEKL